jgi:raffinose/stachyose/melibiose transport system permease protein
MSDIPFAKRDEGLPRYAAVVATTRQTSRRRQNTLYAVWRLAVLIVVAGIVLLPLLATVLGGFKDLGELRTNPLGLPHVWLWHNYWDILISFRYWRVLGNSLLIATFTVILTVALAATAAFAFAHLRFFGRRFLFNYLVLGLMFPAAAAILPLFIRVRQLGLVDTPWGVILPQVAFGLAMGVLLMRNAYRQLPGELLDAALVDGCGYMRYFFHITLPLSRPILSTVGIIAFVGSWNNYLVPLIMLDTSSLYPWPLGLMDYEGEYSTSWQLVLAFITLTILPAIAMFLLAQKYIVEGLTAGAVKG